MKMTTLLKFVAWLCLFFIGLDLAYYMITMPNTIANIGGVFLLALTIIISIKTKCLTNFKKQKNEN